VSLAASLRYARGRAPERSTADTLAARLRDRLGSDRVSVEVAARRAASADYAFLSPVLAGALPTSFADVVAYPRSMDELTAAVELAVCLDVPIVPRGKGTGNYGQAVPLAAGLVIDMSGMDSVLSLGDGWIRAEAGATFVALEAAARRAGQELAMVPTTIGSTIGGFLAGGAGGIGSIEHGWLWDGFVAELAVVTPAGMVSVRGQQCLPYLHAYGVTGIIAAVTVKLAPWRERVGVVVSYDTFDAAVAAGKSLLALESAPRMVSIDDPSLVALYAAQEWLPHGRYSLRALVDHGFEASSLASGGGRVELVSQEATGHLCTLAFNHVTLRAKKVRPELCHLQVGGAALVGSADAVRSALPGGLLHLDGLSRQGFGGLLLSEFRDTATLYEGIARLRALGVTVVDPHTWLLGGPALPDIRATAQANDPKGLLNPGKLPPVVQSAGQQ
jgi:FAD/FMN-containing dehydrogenase